MRTCSVSFGAKPLDKITIKKLRNGGKEVSDITAYFIKLDSKNRMDINAVDKLVKKWKDAKYINKISTASHWMGVKGVGIEIFGITEQAKDFERLKANKILCLAEMRNDNDNSQNKILYHLQVNPKAMNINKSGKKKYRYVGSSMLKSLKNVYKSISLFADDDINVKNFYKKNGFIEDFCGYNHFSWNSSPFKRFKIYLQKLMMRNGF